MLHRKVSFTASAFTILESGLEMSGHFVRDIAVLVLVFVPLDVWKHQEVTVNRLTLLVVVSLIVFGFGLVLQWASHLVQWAKGIWEEENME